MISQGNQVLGQGHPEHRPIQEVHLGLPLLIVEGVSGWLLGEGRLRKAMPSMSHNARGAGDSGFPTAVRGPISAR